MKRNFFFRTKNAEKYIMTQDVLKNPLIGFAPNAAFLSEVDDSNLVYVGITMRELEPEENVFDFETIEKVNHINKWRKEGKHAVFRLICDYPGLEKHLDIPDWLFDKTGGNGAFYDNAYGKGYSPDYADPDFIECHKRAVNALGKRYGEDTFISYIELGSLGHWGEWHIHEGNDLPSIPPESIQKPICVAI
ncbi:MAG: hypothetical protein U5K84_09285 [Alkalibacterium sp.]|nr:hypothetical protein [Alkalibacterium sp.]